MSERKPWILASNNQKKAKEISQILELLNLEIVTPKQAGISLDVEEWGTTFAQNATLKSLAFARAWQGIAIADDSGLSVDGLNGAPGVYSARYAGEGSKDEQNNQKLIATLAANPELDRTCRYHAVISVARPSSAQALVLPEVVPVTTIDSKEAFAELPDFGAYLLPAGFSEALGGPSEDTYVWLFAGTMEGEVSLTAAGEGGFGYDPYVRIADGRHVAELSDSEKNERSHRAMALQAMHISMM